MSLNLYIDLRKNTVTIQGTTYDVTDTPKEGYEPYKASDGRTLYRKPAGRGSTDSSGSRKDTPKRGETDTSGSRQDKFESNDPLKEGQPSTEKAPDLEGAKDIADKMESPFEDPKQTENMSVMEHYHAANLADKLGDQKAAQEHRDHAKDKTAGHDGVMHDDMAQQLRAAGYHDDAAYHSGKRAELIQGKASEHLDELRQQRAASGKGPLDVDVEDKGEEDPFTAQAAKMKARAERMKQKQGGQEAAPAQDAKTQEVFDKEKEANDYLKQHGREVSDKNYGTPKQVLPRKEGETGAEWNERMRQSAKIKDAKHAAESERSSQRQKEIHQKIKDRREARQAKGKESGASKQAVSSEDKQAVDQQFDQMVGDFDQKQKKIEDKQAVDQQFDQMVGEFDQKEADRQKKEDKQAVDQQFDQMVGEFDQKQAEADKKQPKAEQAKQEPPKQEAAGSASAAEPKASKEEPKKPSTPEERQKAAQKRAVSEFSKRSDAHEASKRAAKEEQAKYEKELKDHEQALADHSMDLERLKDRMQGIKDRKPVKDTTETDKLKKQISELRRRHQEHKLNKPDKRKLRDAQSKIKDQQKKLKESHKADLDKLKEKHEARMAKHERTKPMRKQNESDADFNARIKSHKNHAQLLKDGYDKDVAHEKETHTSKQNALTAQHAMLAKDHQSNVDAHAAESEKMGRQMIKLTEKHEKAKEKAKTSHEKASATHKKQLDAHKEKVKEHVAAKKDLPKKPAKPKKTKESAKPRAPQTPEQEAAHSAYTAHHAKQAANIEEHLKNPDLSPEQRDELEKLHEEHSYHANTMHMPSKEDKAASRDLTNRTKQVAPEPKKQKQKAEAAKEEPRPPKDEFERAQVHDHASQAKNAAANIRSHLENNSDIPDDERKVMEDMASKLDEHADGKTVPTKEQQKELKDALKHTKKYSKKNFEESQGKQKQAAPAEPKEDKKKPAKKKTGSILRWYARGAAVGRAAAASANPYGAAGAVGAGALRGSGRGVASAGHWLLSGRNTGGKDSPAQKPAAQANVRGSDKPSKEAQGIQTEKSLRIYIRNGL